MKKVCHLTTVHPRNDIRIFYKECMSLAYFGHDINLVVADGKGDELISGVKIHDIGNQQGRLKRFLLSSLGCYKKALELDANIYHFHDPELLFVGLALKRKGFKVVFDSHELTGRQIKRKFYIPKLLRNITSSVFEYIELGISKRLDAVVVPQEAEMVSYFGQSNTKVQVLSNYVSLSEYKNFDSKVGLSNRLSIKLLYSGSISNDRGLGNMLDLIEYLDERFQLILVGRFASKIEQEKAKEHSGWVKVDYRGLLERKELSSVYQEADLGLILFNPVGQYKVSTSPLKLFEYLLYGMPVITPNYGSWPDFQKKHNVTFGQDVSNINALGEIIYNLINNDNIYSSASQNGRDVVQKLYNWENESLKLNHLYEQILGENNE
jgi:glycosyltransferase involved in cell wall biosynthesis